MKSFLSILIPAAIASAVVSCSDGGSTAQQPGSNEISFLCGFAASGRASDTSFDADDRIGVYIVEEGAALELGGNELNNELFTFDGSSWKSSRKVYWNEGVHDVYAYYPYNKKVNDTRNYTFDVQTDQSDHSGLTASDFVWASADGVVASSAPVPLQFSHRMSKVVVRLEKSDDFKGDIPSDCEVYIHSTVGRGLIDLSTGDVMRDNDSGTVTVKACKTAANEYQAIVVPQNLSSRRPLVEVVTQGVSYLMEGTISFRQGCSHSVVVTLTRNPEQTKIEIGGSIGGWN